MIKPARLGRVALGAALLGATGCGESGFRIEPMSLRVPGQSADPAIAVLPGSRRLLLSWIGGTGRSWTLRVSGSDDRGLTWSAPIDIAGGGHGDEVQPHGESSPRLVAAPGGRVALTWVTNVPVNGRRWPATRMRVARSMDGGATWSAPVTLNDDSTDAPVGHQFHGAAWLGDSALVVGAPLRVGRGAQRGQALPRCGRGFWFGQGLVCAFLADCSFTAARRPPLPAGRRAPLPRPGGIGLGPADACG